MRGSLGKCFETVRKLENRENERPWGKPSTRRPRKPETTRDPRKPESERGPRKSESEREPENPRESPRIPELICFAALVSWFVLYGNNSDIVWGPCFQGLGEEFLTDLICRVAGFN